MTEKVLEIEKRISALITDLRLEVDPSIESLAADTPILGQGVGLDSVEALTLVLAIEEEFNIVIDDKDLSKELFRTVRTLSKCVAEKLESPLP